MNGSEFKVSVRTTFFNNPHKSDATEQFVRAYNEAVDVCQRVTLHVIKPLIIKCGIDALQRISDGLQLAVTAADNNTTLTERHFFQMTSPTPPFLAVSM